MSRALAIKSETDSTLTIEGWGVVFGGEDLTAEYFSEKTDFWLEQLGPAKMTLFDHGQDSSLKSTVLGSGTLERKALDDGTEGLWFTAQLDKSVAYVGQVAKLAKAGALGASSGAVSHLVERIQEDGKTWIKSWPIAEMSLTVTPCEPRTLGYETLKSTVIRAEALKAGRKVHQVKALSFEALRERLYQLINPSSPFVYEPDWTYIVETYPDHVIVCREDVDGDGDGGYWRFTYTVAADDTVQLGEPVQVEQTYVPVTKSLVEHAEALKALLPKEAPSKGVSEQRTPTQPTKRSTPEITVSDPTPAQETPMTPEEMATLTDSVSAKFAPQFDAITQILERFENEPALKSAGHISVDGGAADKSVKTFADFLVSIRRGDMKRLETVYATKAALAEDGGTTGGYLVPTEFRNQLLQVAAETSIVRSRAMPLPMGAREVEIPALDQATAPSAGNSAFFGGVVMKWASEASSYDETEPKFRMVRLTAHKLEGYTLSSNELLADSAQALESLLRALFGQAIGWYEDFAFLRGDGAGKPLGVLNAPAAVTVSRNTSTSFKIQDIGAMLAKLPASSFGRAAWLMHQTLIPQLIQLSLTNATIVSFVGDLKSPLGAQLMGLPILFTEKLPALGTLGDVVLADLGMYVVGDRQQLAIASSEHYKFVNGQMTWRFDERVDGQPWLKGAITLADAATTVSPFVILS